MLLHVKKALKKLNKLTLILRGNRLVKLVLNISYPHFINNRIRISCIHEFHWLVSKTTGNCLEGLLFGQPLLKEVLLKKW